MTGCIGGIFITGIFGNFYTKRGEFLTFKTGIPVALAASAESGGAWGGVFPSLLREGSGEGLCPSPEKF